MRYILCLLLLFLISPVYSASYPELVIPSSTTVVVSNDNLDFTSQNWSEEDLCNFVKGCLIYDNYYNSYCYPLGYEINDTYCSEVVKSETPGGFKKYENKFLNQSNANEECVYHYECKSNFCFNNRCIDNIEDEIIKLSEEIGNLKNLIHKNENIILINESKEINNSIREDKENLSEKNNYFKFFKKLFNLK